MTPELRATFRKPFDEQVAAFRLRLATLQPTARWDDVWQSQHDRAFMVAGAMKADLLADLAAAVDKAVTEGRTLEEFRRDFRDIVERNGWHGWTGEDSARGRAWRTRVIYQTNMRTSYAAGRWAQLMAAGYPLLVYRHGGSLDPRIQHLGWDGLILPSDHPFWQTHAPPNGWGCSCYLNGARSEAGAVRVGGKPGLRLPEGWQSRDPKTGAPVGIDRGWAYAPGASVAQDVAFLGNRLNVWPFLMAKGVMRELPEEQRDLVAISHRVLPSTAKAVAQFASTVMRRGPEADGVSPVQSIGMLTTAEAVQVEQLSGKTFRHIADFAVEPGAVLHVMSRHGEAGIELSRGQRPVTLADWARLPILLSQPDAVVRDGDNGGLPVLRYSKNFEDGTLHALLKVLPARSRLSLLTMYVQKAGSPRISS